MLSKTQEPCDCGAISAILNDPDSGLTLSQDNTFQLGNHFCVYHCPFCGGLLPDSSLPIWYPRLDAQERSRLQRLVAGITTAEEAIERLGLPDYDAMMHHYDSLAGGMPLVVSEHDEMRDSQWAFNQELSTKCRNLEYYNLSEHADIEFYFHADYGPRCEIVVKYISPRHMAKE